MSSSSDIEKLFDHFGGDASAYQEIGRENEARSARTRWPLLETLDLTQPAIPAIGQRRELKAQTPANIAQPVVGDEDTTPKDAASVTRAKAPLFTRSPRRDIPPVVVAAPPSATPSGGSRFGVLETAREAETPVAAGAARVEAVAPVAAAVAPVAAVPPTAPAASMAPATPVAQIAPVAQTAPMPSTAQTAASQASPLAAPSWAQAPAPARAYTSAPAAPIVPAAPAAPAQPASILGKLFAPAPQPAPQQPAAASGESAPLQSVFDRLRGNPAQPSAAPTGAARPTAPNSWLINGPRRS
jgi:hypothetical protein